MVTMVVGLALNATPSAAFSGGITGHSGNPTINFGAACSACHGGGSAPVVELTGPAIVAPGSVHTYVLTVQSAAPAQQTAAGLNVSATAGLLASLGADTQVLDDEITQTAPKANDGSGLASFSFQWTAPATAQTLTLYAAGNSVDLDGFPFGDDGANTALVIEVTDPTAVRLAGFEASSPDWAAPALVAALLLLLACLAIVYRRAGLAA
ncbi:MAG TPA: choice-of-anchor V domain-containing protein, partial [Rubrivivax sp.]|nr:choice-of-anchor V domain-containing protein [Rubrivivax sp.]